MSFRHWLKGNLASVLIVEVEEMVLEGARQLEACQARQVQQVRTERQVAAVRGTLQDQHPAPSRKPATEAVFLWHARLRRILRGVSCRVQRLGQGRTTHRTRTRVKVWGFA